MNLILLIFLSGGFSSEFNYEAPNYEEPDMEPVRDEENREEEIHIPDDEKSGHHYTDTKKYVFTTPNRNGTRSEISVKATTELNFSLRNYKATNETTTSTTGKFPGEKIPKSTQVPNESAFWTMLSKVLNETKENEEAKDELYQPIPGSDLNATDEDKGTGPQEAKLKLMLGISLMTLLLFSIILAISSALLYKLKINYKERLESEHPANPDPETASMSYVQPTLESEYPVNRDAEPASMSYFQPTPERDYPTNPDPELASMSYFQPSEGVSDTSFSKSADSSTLLDTKSKSRTTNMVSPASEEEMNEPVE